MIKEMFNHGFERGFTIFQWFLIIAMVVGAFQNNQQLVLISLSACLIGYFEPDKHDALGRKDETK